MFTVYLAVQSRFQRRFNSPTPSDAGEPHFFFPANAWTHKNHEVLLLAYRLYRRNVLSAGGRPWPLELTGHEDERWRTLQSVASSLGLTSSVHFRGFVDSPTMEGLWSGAGCLVFPSLHEGFGIPLLEAMHHGVPVIASDATSLPEVGGDACVFVNARKPEALADAMIRVASNPALRGDLARRGRERIRSFCWPDEAARLLDRIIELAQGRAWRPAVWGVDDDGFMDDVAHISLPRLDVRCRLEITTERTKRSPRIVLAAGDAPLGSLNPGVEPHGRFSTSIYPNGRALRLLVRRRKRWSWFRFRSPRRDACLTSARLICPDGAAIDLLGRS
jgi:hypothetical protein